MLKIRLSRAGAKKQPYYRIVVTESSMSRDGRYVELIGFSNPMASGKEPSFRLNDERYNYWKSQGAQETPVIKRLVRRYRQNNNAEAA